MGPLASANSDSGLSKARNEFLTRCPEKGDPLRCGGSTQQRLVPLASLRSARVAGGFRLSFEVAAVELLQFRPAA
jgi:hypothetical protein